MVVLVIIITIKIKIKLTIKVIHYCSASVLSEAGRENRQAELPLLAVVSIFSLFIEVSMFSFIIFLFLRGEHFFLFKF